MEWYILILAGILGGVIGGMGMGGGTLTIPILVYFLGFSQIESQFINLISFIPMSIVVSIIYFKNKLIDVKKTLYVIPSAIVFTILGSLVSNSIEGDYLKIIFGVFLISISVIFLLKFILNKYYLLFNSRKSIGRLSKYVQKSKIKK